MNATPERVPNLDDIVQVAAGAAHSVALDGSGDVWVWGSNEHGQLATSGSAQSSTPQKVNLSLPARTVVADGDGHFSLALLTDGTVWGWGRNSEGQLGNGSTSDANPEPGQVSGLGDVTGIAVGGKHSLAITADGSVWAWGQGGDGQLGDGARARRITPVRVINLP